MKWSFSKKKILRNGLLYLRKALTPKKCPQMSIAVRITFRQSAGMSKMLSKIALLCLIGFQRPELSHDYISRSLTWYYGSTMYVVKLIYLARGFQPGGMYPASSAPGNIDLKKKITYYEPTQTVIKL